MGHQYQEEGRCKLPRRTDRGREPSDCGRELSAQSGYGFRSLRDPAQTHHEESTARPPARYVADGRWVRENKQDENDLLVEGRRERGSRRRLLRCCPCLKPKKSDIVTHNLHQQMMKGRPRSTRCSSQCVGHIVGILAGI